MAFIDQKGWQHEDTEVFTSPRSKFINYLPFQALKKQFTPLIKSRYALHEKYQCSLPLKIRHKSTRVLQLPKIKNASAVEVKSFHLILDKEKKEKSRKQKKIELKGSRHRRIFSEQDPLVEKGWKRRSLIQVQSTVRKLQIKGKVQMDLLGESSVLSHWEQQLKKKQIENVKVFGLPHPRYLFP